MQLLLDTNTVFVDLYICNISRNKCVFQSPFYSLCDRASYQQVLKALKSR